VVVRSSTDRRFTTCIRDLRRTGAAAGTRSLLVAADWKNERLDQGSWYRRLWMDEWIELH